MTANLCFKRQKIKMTTKMDKHDKIDKNNTKEKMTKNAKKNDKS